MRLYETLCLGRIPLLINTDCILPFENIIDWKLCLWVDENDINKIGQIILDFHSSMSNDEFKEIDKVQRNMGKLLSKEGFAKQLINVNNKK